MDQDINYVSNIYPNAAGTGASAVESPAICAHGTWFALTSLALLSACGPREKPPVPKRADWVLAIEGAVLRGRWQDPATGPKEELRLWVPYVVGDLYGAPNAGELAPVALKPDLSFALDLNKSHEKLAKALVPTEFSQKWMAIEPAPARVARLSPFVLPVDGIVPVGSASG